MRPGFRVDEIALIHGIPPWHIDASRPAPRMWERSVWRLRACLYRIGLRRLATLRLSPTSSG